MTRLLSQMGETLNSIEENIPHSLSKEEASSFVASNGPAAKMDIIVI